ncbi:MAG: Crp/Fnr family transcriptional regulator [Arenicellales bacterium]
MALSNVLSSVNSAVFQVRPQPFKDCAECEVRKMALFQGVPYARLNWTQQYREAEFDVTAKNQLYLEKIKPRYAFTLVSGWVALYKTMEDGSRQILKYALPGDLLGFNVCRDGTATHSAEAITDVRLCAFSVENIAQMMGEQPEIALRLIEMNARDMSICQQHLVCAGKKDARARLAYLILETYHRVRKQSPTDFEAQTNSIRFPLTQELLGDTLGLTNVHVNRMLKKLKVDDLITCQHGRLAILDEKRLTELAQFDLDAQDVHPLV